MHNFSTSLIHRVQILPTLEQFRRLRLLLIGALLLSSLALAMPVHAEEGVHVVRAGDTLSTIAQAYGVSASDLAASNGVSNQNIIFTGQRLVIPGSAADQRATTVAGNALPAGDGYYTVQRGDMLTSVAKANGMTLTDVMRLNGLTDPNFIWVGQKLRVSARVSLAEAPDAKPEVADAIYVVQVGDSLSQIAQDHNTTTYVLMAANGLPNANFVWVGQRLRIQEGSAGGSVNPAAAPADGYRWIEVNLSNQTLTAWQGDVAVMYTNISSGLGGTPTVTGRFAINTKLSAQRMTGPGYDLPNVPWVMYFYGGYALHGAYWHNNFGSPMSHGCVNMRPGEAQILYNWASVGTEVYVHY